MQIEMGDRVFCEKDSGADAGNKLHFNGIVTELRDFQGTPADLLILDCDGSPVSVRRKHVVKVEAKAKSENEDKF